MARSDTWILESRPVTWEVLESAHVESREVYPALLFAELYAAEPLLPGSPVLATGGPLLSFTLGV